MIRHRSSFLLPLQSPRTLASASGLVPNSRVIWPYVLLGFHVLGVLSSLRALFESRTPQGTIAWLVSLNTFPYLAVPAYWVFGRRRFQGYIKVRRRRVADAGQQAEAILQTLTERGLLVQPRHHSPLLAEKLARLPFTRGNDAELFDSGEAAFASMLEGIKAAKDYVLVQFYIIRDDGLGQTLQETLLDQASRGVRVYLLYDEIGSHQLPRSYVTALREGGVDARPFHTSRGRANRFQLNFRNHRKIVVVDGLQAWVGGLNVGDEYLGYDEHFGAWRDTHVQVSGPGAMCVQVPFLEDWRWAAGEIPSLNWDPHPSPGGGDLPVLCLPTGPADSLETCTLFFLNAIGAARRRLWIASPYFVPDEQFVSALQLAALRGVDVRILIPENPDHVLVQLAAWSFLEDLCPAGVQFFRYQPGFMHQKVMLVDDEVAAIGTANFDNRSFRLNFEITMVFDDRGFAAQVEEMLERDLSRARLVGAGEFDERPFLWRLAVRLARLLAPIQ